MSEWAVVTPWRDPAQLESFLDQWAVPQPTPDWLVLQHDSIGEGCGATKNKGIRVALDRGADVVVVLDDDCYPGDESTLPNHARAHLAALQPARADLYHVVTSPPSRGTPYSELAATLPVAASMGYWTGIGDYCAVRQLAHRAAPMEVLDRGAVYWRWFSLCGMNLAYRPIDWLPWCNFIEVPRFDDIWMGWLWQREAYRRGFCFNLGGPMVRHVRQSNPWRNLIEETRYIERSEVLWREIALSSEVSYEVLCRLLPDEGGGR